MSSILSSALPPSAFAARHVNNAENAWPRCRWPLGLGAKRRMADIVRLSSAFFEPGNRAHISLKPRDGTQTSPRPANLDRNPRPAFEEPAASRSAPQADRQGRRSLRGPVEPSGVRGPRPRRHRPAAVGRERTRHLVAGRSAARRHRSQAVPQAERCETPGSRALGRQGPHPPGDCRSRRRRRPRLRRWSSGWGRTRPWRTSPRTRASAPGPPRST